MIMTFKPRFLMSAHERSLRDLRHSGVDTLREQLIGASERQRDELWTTTLGRIAYHRHDYRMNVLTVLGAVFVCAVNLVVGIRTGNYWLLGAAIAVVGVMVTNMGEYEYKRDLYYGSLRLIEEFKRDEPRHEVDDET